MIVVMQIERNQDYVYPVCYEVFMEDEYDFVESIMNENFDKTEDGCYWCDDKYLYYIER